MGMQVLLWMLKMRHQQWRVCQGDRFLQDIIKKKNCVKAHNKTCTRPHLLHLLQTQGEEKGFLIGHLLAPNHFFFLFYPKKLVVHILNIQPPFTMSSSSFESINPSLGGNLVGCIIYFFFQ